MGNFSAASSSNAKSGVGVAVGGGVTVGVSVGNGVGDGMGVSVGIGVLVGGSDVGLGGAGGCAATASELLSCDCGAAGALAAGCAGAPPVSGVTVQVANGVTVGVGCPPPKLQPVDANPTSTRTVHMFNFR